MSYDGLVLHAVRDELERELVGGRIDRIYQQEKDELLLYIHTKTNRTMLLLSASGNNPRVYQTEHKKENPPQPPMFCMLLRKHLIGSKILGIKQYLMDRILKIELETVDELGDYKKKSLIIEIMGRHSNIIFYDDEEKEIIDAITRVNATMSSLREVLPGKPYDPSILGDKVNPLDDDRSRMASRLEAYPKARGGKRFLMDTYTGISPLIAREILYRSDIDETFPLQAWEDRDKEKFLDRATEIFEDVKKGNYTFQSVENDEIFEFSAIPLLQFPDVEVTEYDSASEMLDRVYTERDRKDRLIQKSHALKKSVRTHLDRSKNKQKKLWREYEDALDRDKYKVYGDVLSAYADSVERGLSEVFLPNFYSTKGEEIRIPLDPKLSPIGNAGRFYKRYSKLKHGAKLLEGQLEENKNAMEYLENTLLQIDMAETPGDIDDIRRQYRRDFHKKPPKNRKKEKDVSRPMEFKTPAGSKIYVGKNNRQNEEVTFKKANRRDLWFHVKEHPGSHVILKSDTGEYRNSDMIQAAKLAAYYSSLRNAKHVDVDYTFKKNVKRHPSNRPGLVNYVNYKTVHVSGSKEILKELERLV